MSLLRNMHLTKRSIGGEYVKGQWKQGVPVDTSFMGTAQPASGRVLELLPSGKRNFETITVFAPVELEFTPADEQAQVSGDIIIWEGRHYEIISARPWKAGLISHWELTASRIQGR
jgi:hypothetical protein